MTDPVIDGNTAYVMPGPSIGATADAALAAGGGAIRHVVVCGPSAGAGRAAREWANDTGAWSPAGVPYLAPAAMRAALYCDGAQVNVSRAAAWFGDVGPVTAAAAMRTIRHIAGRKGARVYATPGRTGAAMLRAIWHRQGVELDPCPVEVAELLRSTSGQGRFQLFEPAAAGGRRLYGVDARFQYAALAGTELPGGEPVEVVGAPADPYAPAWCEVEFEPAGPIGVLGVPTGERRAWHWPTSGGPYVAWCSGAELMAAVRAGYRVTVRRAIVWPVRRRYLGEWSAYLIRERERAAGLPIEPAVVAAVRYGLRAMVIQTVGMMHGRAPARQCSAGHPSEIPADASRIRRSGDRWLYDMPGEPSATAINRPEWSTAIWGLARARLAGQMLAQRAPVVACALDGFYTAGKPVVADDNGRAGQWRASGSWRNWPALSTMSDLYGVTGGS